MNLDLSCAEIQKLYSNLHKVEVLSENVLRKPKHVLININKKHLSLEIKLRDQNDFSFNYTAVVDKNVFDQMKNEQHLEICFEEFYLQFSDLLKRTLSKETLLRLEQNDRICKMVFYERSKIKSLILLIIDLISTDQKDIIREMAVNIDQLKESNNCTNSQLQITKNQLQEKNLLLNSALTTYHQMQKKFIQDIKCIENAFTEGIDKIERHVSSKVDTLNERYDKLLRQMEMLKNECKYRENIYAQALFQLEQFEKDNEKNYKMIDTLKLDIKSLSSQKIESEETITDLKQIITKKDMEMDTLDEKIVELQKDIQEATIIIAKKTKTHDEIAKDLVQANTMLVNFNKQYDTVSKEVDYLRNVLKSREEVFEQQTQHLKQINNDFMMYKKECNIENLHVLQQELKKCQDRIAELEKHNREAVKINGLLTKKLANGDLLDMRNIQRTQHK